MSEDMFDESPATEESRAISNLLEDLLRNSEDQPQEGILTGFVAMVEWMRPDGTFGVWRYNGDSLGNALPTWRINGLLDYGKGVFADVDEDDETV